MTATAGKLDIFNMALGFAGQRTIASQNENTPEAIQCGLFWDRARRSALQDFPYNFAARRIRLAEKAVPEGYENQWPVCYGLPAGCLKVIRICDSTTGGCGNPLPFCIRNIGQETVILTSVKQAFADCVVDVPETALWSELFVMAMARKLACLIAVPLLKNNPQKVQELEQLYQQAIPLANGQDAAEGRRQTSITDSDPWLSARGLW